MILVTGGAGFIGSNFIATLNERGRDDVVVCDWLGTGDKWRNLASARFADFVPPEHLAAWLDGAAGRVEAVIHMGAVSSTTAVDGDEVIENNFRVPLAILNWCTRHQTPLLYASSAAVYGDGSVGFDDDSSPPALRRLRPLNLYGWSKRQFDLVVAERLARREPLPPVCAGLRFFNVFGPNEYHKGEMRSVVAKIAAPIQAGEQITLFRSHRDGIADGDQRRDFIYVKDAVAIGLGLLGKGGLQGFFNVGTGVARSFRDLAGAVFRAFGRDPEITYVDMPAALRSRYQYYTEASMRRVADEELGVTCAPLEHTVADYVASYLAAEHPYR